MLQRIREAAEFRENWAASRFFDDMIAHHLGFDYKRSTAPMA
jgi:hypothetical protein